MLKNKVITAEQAIALINDGDVVCTTGFVQSCVPEMLHAALEKRFVESQEPKGPHAHHVRRRRRQQRAGHRAPAS